MPLPDACQGAVMLKGLPSSQGKEGRAARA